MGSNDRRKEAGETHPCYRDFLQGGAKSERLHHSQALRSIFHSSDPGPRLFLSKQQPNVIVAALIIASALLYDPAASIRTGCCELASCRRVAVEAAGRRCWL